MRILLTVCLLLAAPALAAKGVLHGRSRGWSAAGFTAACLVAKAPVHAPLCQRGAYERAVGACECTSDARGVTCEVEYAAACRSDAEGQSSIAISGTWQGSSTAGESHACFAARLAAKGVACPRTTLDRQVGACSCAQEDGRYECLVDQILWCQL